MRQNNSSETAEKVKGVSLRLIVVLGIFVSTLLLLLFVTDEIVLENEQGFDTKVFQLLETITSPGNTTLMTFFTFFGSRKFLFPAYLLLALYYIIFKKNTRRSLNIAAIGLSSFFLLLAIKNIFKRHRPPNPLITDVTGFSYPSGHSFSAFTFGGLLIYILWESHISVLWKYIGTFVLFVFAALVAISRVYLHVHYASDVLAGFCLSCIWLTICIYVLEKLI